MTMQVEAKRIPRRVLHFSDGVIEEFSTDDEAEKEEEEKRQKEANQQVSYPSYIPPCMTWHMLCLVTPNTSKEVQALGCSLQTCFAGCGSQKSCLGALGFISGLDGWHLNPCSLRLLR